jgi:predicted RNA-binding Zn ribbon-like protein
MSQRSAGQAERGPLGGMHTVNSLAFELTGGRLCLDLANTLDQRPTDHPRELLPGYRELLAWGVQAGAVTRAEARALRRAAAGDPSAARAAVGRSRRAREAIFKVFSAVARHRSIPPPAIALLGEMVRDTSTRRRLEQRAGAFHWGWSRDGADLDRVLWPAVWSAAELLTSADRDRVRQCAGAGCAWLFIDSSRNRSRRWCDMAVCGNRAKARRHQAKVKRPRQGKTGRVEGEAVPPPGRWEVRSSRAPQTALAWEPSRRRSARTSLAHPRRVQANRDSSCSAG